MKNSDFISNLCEEFIKYNQIDPEEYNSYKVLRGLRYPDGTGVVAGITKIGNVHGYVLNEGEKMPVEGELTYRGINVADIVNGCREQKRFGFEEVIYLLLFGYLPTKSQLMEFMEWIDENRELPEGFSEDMIMKAPSRDIMNKLGRSVLAMYSYDDNPDDISIENVLRQCLQLIARFSTIIAYSYRVKRYVYDKQSLYIHTPKKGLSLAENFLYTMRHDHKFTHEEAEILDICLILHAEHGGGNNSAFACRTLASSGTDTYAAISAAVGSLKGPKHGGASNKVAEMFECIKQNVKNWKDEGEVREFLTKIIKKEACDGSGLIYGMGHAIYTVSDPRAVILKEYARNLAEQKGMVEELNLMESVEKLSPDVFREIKGLDKPISANVDYYSGFVYKMLGISPELYTPLFAMSRIVGWSAHRIEELLTGGRIIRPAYKAIMTKTPYLYLEDR